MKAVYYADKLFGFYKALQAGVAQLARASAFQAEGRGFESRLPLFGPATAGCRSDSSVVESVLGKDEVAGSIPAQSLQD